MSIAVFMSYSHENAAFVNRLRTDLQARNIRVWIDHESLPPGTSDWDEAIRVALRSVHAVLFIASPASRKSLYVRDELKVAQMYERTIYPVWAAGDHWMECVPLGWGATQYVDARGASYAAALQALVQALNGASASPPATPSASPANPPRVAGTNADETMRQKLSAASIIDEIEKQLQAQAPQLISYDLSTLRALLAAKDWGKADEESKSLLRAAGHLPSDGRINSEEKARAIPADLLKEMDALWRDASGAGLRSRPWLRYSGGLTDFVAWWSFETWLDHRLKEVGL